jgi:hypothetical protein
LSDEEEPGDREELGDVAEDGLIEEISSAPSPGATADIDVPALWRSLIDVEAELTTEGVALSEGFFDRNVRRHVVPFELSSGTFDFDRADTVGVQKLDAKGTYRDAITRAGDVRADRKTAPIAGSLLISDNRKRFIDVLDYGGRAHPTAPHLMLWLTPLVQCWGATTLVDETIAGIRARWSGQREGEQARSFKSICLSPPRPPRYLEKAFDFVCVGDYRQFPGPLEILLVPHVAAAVVVHAPIETARGYPVPLGFVSFDQAVLRRAEQYMLENLSPYFVDESLYRAYFSLSGQPLALSCTKLSRQMSRRVVRYRFGARRKSLHFRCTRMRAQMRRQHQRSTSDFMCVHCSAPSHGVDRGVDDEEGSSGSPAFQHAALAFQCSTRSGWADALSHYSEARGDCALHDS